MGASVRQTLRKPFALSVVLALFLAITLAISMQQLWGSSTVALAAGEEVQFFDENNIALATRDIRLLCFNGLLDTSPDDIRFVTTNGGAMPVPLPAGCTHVAALHLWHTQPSGKPEHGPAYWVYTTSWQPGSSDLTPIVVSGTTNITIPNKNSLVLFNMVIGLAWQPPKDSTYLLELYKGLGGNSVINDGESASSYLYDLTEGTMAIGPVTLHVDGKEWESTDIRIVPANDLKPSAQVGGIVAQSFNFTSTVFVTATTVYSPGAITMGRNWAACAPAGNISPPSFLIACNPGSGVTDTVKLYGASDSIATGFPTPKYGNWDDAPGFRTIVHEWAHYALFLYDEYQTVQAQPAHCTSMDNKLLANDDKNASAMDWHYTASEFWHEMPPPGTCDQTKQYLFHGLSDCKTLAAWYTIQQIPNASTLPPLGCDGSGSGEGPASLGVTKFLFGRQPPAVSPPTRFPFSIRLPGIKFGPPRLLTPEAGVAEVTQSTIDALVQVQAELFLPPPRDPPSFLHVYQLRPDGDESYNRIWYQGKVFSDTSNADLWTGHVTVLGAQNEVDDVKIFGESYLTDLPGSGGGRWFGQSKLIPNTTVLLRPDDWPASMDLEFEVNPQGQVVTVTAHVSLPVIGPPDQIKAAIQICSPDTDVRCYWDQPLTLISATATQEYWRGSVHPTSGQPTLPNYGIVRLYVIYDLGRGQPEKHELMSWYKTSGVGPGSHNALAPTPPNEDDIVTLFSETVRRHCNQLIYSAATNAEILESSLGEDGDGNPFVGLVGQPLDLAVRLPFEADGAECPGPFGQGSRTVAQQDIYLTLSYNHLFEVRSQEIIRDYLSPEIESKLQILFYNPNTGWEVVLPASTTRNPTMNWISVPFRQDGIYAIGWVKP